MHSTGREKTGSERCSACTSGRKMIEALIAGEKDPAKLARLAHPRVKASQESLRQALRGRVTKSHRFLLRLHLRQVDAIDAAIAEIDREVEAGITPFRNAVEQLSAVPGIKSLAAQTILSEIGIDEPLPLQRSPDLLGVHLPAQRRKCR